MKLDEIKEVVGLMLASDLVEFELEEEGRRIAIKRGAPPAPALPPPPPASAAPPPAAVAEAEPAEEQNCEIVKAPFVGTFYAAPSPDSPPYVKLGQEVNADSVLCIVEAMKVMNEIKAEVRGIIREIMAENARPVQYGQPLFKIEKI